MKNCPKILLPSLAALLLGSLLTLAFSPYNVFPFAIIAPAGLFALLLNTSPKRALCLGFFFGLGLFGTGVYWVFISIHVIGEVPTLLAGIITALFIAILSVFPASVAYVANRYFADLPPAAKLIYVYPALWVTSEWIRSFIFTGFPWLFIGYSQTNSPLKGFAPLLGVYGISFIALLTSALFVHAFIQLKQRQYLRSYTSLFIILTLWIGGGLLNLIKWTKAQQEPISVALVQGNIAQTIKWTPEFLQLSLDRYQSLTEPLWKKDTLIIWPEAAIPMALQDASDFINQLNDRAKKSQASLILGIPIRNENGDYYNAVATLGSNNQVYLKRHLVPFGEYTPYSDLFSDALKFMNIPMSNMAPGKPRQEPLELNHTKILTSVCYEIAFPDLIRSTDPNIGLLLTVTNDAWFGKSNAQAQHLQMAAMRSLEFARPLLFVSNDGITAIVNANGEIQAAAPPHTAFVLHGTIQARTGLTPWMRFGSDLILMIIIASLITAYRHKKRDKIIN